MNTCQWVGWRDEAEKSNGKRDGQKPMLGPHLRNVWRQEEKVCSLILLIQR